MPRRDDDSLTEAGAAEMAKRIERYWAAKGHPEVRCQVEAFLAGSRDLRYGIRSNLHAGMPPGPQ